MADDERKGFWQRMKDRLGAKARPQNPSVETEQEAAKQEAADQTEAAEAADTTDQAPPIRGAGPKIEPETETEPEVEPQAEPSSEHRVVSTSELKTDTVGRVYAEALLELAQEQGSVDALADEIQQLLPLISDEGELHRLLTNPAISDDERGAIVKAVFEGKVSGLLYNLLRLLGDKRRLGSLPEVAAGYLLAVAEERGQVDVQAYVATELDPAIAKQVADQIGAALNKSVTLTQQVDPSLIGGLKIKVGDQLIDASVASQLRSMKQKMIAAGRS